MGLRNTRKILTTSLRNGEKTGRPRTLHDEHKSAILECIDENPSIVLDEVMKKLKQMFTELKVSKTILFDFVKTTLQFIS